MNLDYVFGNPSRKRVAKPKRKRKLNGSKGKGMAKKKRNPGYVVKQKGAKRAYVLPYKSPKQIEKTREKIRQARAAAKKALSDAKAFKGSGKKAMEVRAKRFLAMSDSLEKRIKRALKNRKKVKGLVAKIKKEKGSKVRLIPKVRGDATKGAKEEAAIEKAVDKVKKQLEQEVAKKKKKTKKRKAKKKAAPKKRKTKKRKTTKRKTASKKRKAKKATTKKRRKKKTTSKKKVSRKRKKVARKSKAKRRKKKTSVKKSKKRTKKRATSRKKTSRKVRKALSLLKRATKVKKGRSFKIGKKRFKRTNPKGVTRMKYDVKSLTGHSIAELGTLAAGGVGMSLLEGALKKWTPTISDKMVVAGTSLGPLGLAVATNALVKNQQAKRVAKGIVAASLVKASLDAGKMLGEQIGLPMAGVKFIKAPMGAVKQFSPDKMSGMGVAKAFPISSEDESLGSRQYQTPGADFGAAPELVPMDVGDFGRGAMGGVDTVGDFDGYPEMALAGLPSEDADI